jgi:hypothetical protein
VPSGAPLLFCHHSPRPSSLLTALVSPARSVPTFHSLRILLLGVAPPRKQKTSFVPDGTPLAVCSFTLRVNFAAPCDISIVAVNCNHE